MSNNLNLPQMTSNQAQKEVTHNDANGAIDAAVTENLSVDVTAANVTLTSAEFRGAVRFFITGAATAGRTVTLPAVKHAFMVTADPTNTETVSVIKGATSFAIDPGDTALFYTDGTTDGLVQVAGGGGGGYKVSACFLGQPGPADTLIFHVFAETVEFPANLTASQAVVVVDPLASVTMDIKKNGSVVATIDIASGATVATFTCATAVTFAPGDILTIEAPNPADADLEDIAITLLGSL